MLKHNLRVTVAKAVAERLAELLVERGAVPASKPRDALHIATAAANGVQFIVTWNFKHILNPHVQFRIAQTCREAGYIPPRNLHTRTPPAPIGSFFSP